MTDERVIAVGLLTERDLSVLGQGFKRVFRLEEQHDFGALLTAIDIADRDHRQKMSAPAMQVPPPRR